MPITTTQTPSNYGTITSSSSSSSSSSSPSPHKPPQSTPNTPKLKPPTPPTSILPALKRHPTAIGWSIFFSLGIIMTSFDPQLLGNLYATPRFQRDFGVPFRGGVGVGVGGVGVAGAGSGAGALSAATLASAERSSSGGGGGGGVGVDDDDVVDGDNNSSSADDRYIIPAAWLSALSMGSPIGQIFGAVVAAWPMERFGRKRMFGGCVVATAGCVFLQVFASGRRVLLVGELVGGLVLGSYAVIAPAYASEVCPLELRGLVTAYVNLCFVVGQGLANGVVAGTQGWQGPWAWRLPFAVQWLWPVVVLVGLPFAPESPWWLVRRGRWEDARRCLGRLGWRVGDGGGGVDVEEVLREIIETDRLEGKMEAGSSYWDCWIGSNWRRTEIAVGVYSIQVLCGTYLVGYSIYFFTRKFVHAHRHHQNLVGLLWLCSFNYTVAGLPTDKAFEMGMAFSGVGILATCLSWILLIYFGRRKIYNYGLALLAILLFIIGILDCVPNYSHRPVIMWTQSSLLIVWNFFYDLTVGPVCFVILCECSATKLRSKTIAIATAVQACVGVVMTILIPYMISPERGNLRGKLGFFFGALATLSLVWSCLRVPETKGRTFEDLDIMFERRVRTRDFKNYKICHDD